MRLRESTRFAWRGIIANKMRSLLTMLGIVIGVASVITLVAVGTGSNDAVAASISRLGSSTLNVDPDAVRQRWPRQPFPEPVAADARHQDQG